MQEFADVVFETKATLAEYHKREGDPNAVISTWKDDERIITFSVPLSGVPDVVKTAIGEYGLFPPPGVQASFRDIGTLFAVPKHVLKEEFLCRLQHSHDPGNPAEGVGSRWLIESQK